MTADRDVRLAAWWCLNVRRYQEMGDKLGWRSVLDAAMADFESGLSPAELVDKYHLPATEDSELVRSQLFDLEEFRVPSPPVDGGFVCPRERPCGRRAQSDPITGVEPRCEIAARPMRFGPKQTST